MRKLVLTLALFAAAVGTMAATPAQANAWWVRYRAGYYAAPSYYYAPAYRSYYYSGRYFYRPVPGGPGVWRLR